MTHPRRFIFSRTLIGCTDPLRTGGGGRGIGNTVIRAPLGLAARQLIYADLWLHITVTHCNDVNRYANGSLVLGAVAQEKWNTGVDKRIDLVPTTNLVNFNVGERPHTRSTHRPILTTKHAGFFSFLRGKKRKLLHSFMGICRALHPCTFPSIAMNHELIPRPPSLLPEPGYRTVILTVTVTVTVTFTTITTNKHTNEQQHPL